MKLFQSFSIKSKLTVIILVVTVFAIVTGFGFVIYNNIETFRRDMVDNTLLQAKLVGNYCVTPLDFDYPSDAEKVLEKLRIIPYIANAVVYDKNGDIFAVFNKSEAHGCPVSPHQAQVVEFNEDFLYVFHPVIYGGSRYGSICLKASTALLDRKIRDSLITLSLLTVVLILLSFFLASKLQRVISGPIMKLSAVAREISEKKDYSLRVEKISADETGQLYDEFNYMLEQIQVRQLEKDKAEKKYRDIFENAAYGLFQISTDGRLLTANPAFVKILGYDSVDELVDCPSNIRDRLYVEPHKVDEFQELIKAQGYVKDFEFRAFRKDESIIYISESTHAVRDEAGETLYYEGILEDVSQKRRAEELKIGRDAAEASNRAKSEFLANISHEIRTPMNAILGFSELLEGQLTSTLQKQYLKSISSSGKTLLILINDILDLSKIESGKFELQKDIVDLHPVFQEIKTIYSREIKKKKLDFQMDIDPALPEGLVLDEVRMREILFNLVGNAVKFTGEGYVKLTVYRNVKKEDDGFIDLTILVQDSGIGIPQGQLEYIFDAFKQVDRKSTAIKYRGTGLGLSITRRLVEMMGGEITVDSEEGKGSTFRVMLRNVAVSPLIKKSVTHGNIFDEVLLFEEAAVLVVDDVESNRELLKGFLCSVGLSVIEAGNGQRGIELARQYKPALIFMDLRMPVMDGYEAMKIIKADKELRSIPIVVLTASAMKEDEDDIKKASCDGYLKKPVNGIELFGQLKRFLPYKAYPVRMETESDGAVQMVPVPGKPLSSEAKKKLPELLSILKNDFLPRGEKIKKVFIIDEIEDFAVEVRGLGEQYGVDILFAWGGKLFREIQDFDLEELPRTLDDFPELLKQIEAQGAEQLIS